MLSKTDIARTYRKQHPNKPTLALARIMYKDNNLLFRDVENARDSLRHIEGKKGKAGLKNLKDKSLVIATPRPYNPYKLPDSDETIYEPYVLKGFKRAAVLSDIHAPYHSITAISAALDMLKKEKPDVAVLNGDIFDCYQLSRFCRDPKKKNFAEELRIGVSVIETIRKTLKCEIIFRLGNHEDRYQQFLWQKMGELSGIEEFEFSSIIKKRLPDTVVLGDKKLIKLNDLTLLHGHEFASGFFSPVNVARGLYLRAKANAMQGHNHATSSHTESDINGKIVTTFSVGCLCELRPLYMPINKWNHGFAIVDLSSDKKHFEVRNKTIIKGKVY